MRGEADARGAPAARQPGRDQHRAQVPRGVPGEGIALYNRIESNTLQLTSQLMHFLGTVNADVDGNYVGDSLHYPADFYWGWINFEFEFEIEFEFEFEFEFELELSRSRYTAVGITRRMHGIVRLIYN